MVRSAHSPNYVLQRKPQEGLHQTEAQTRTGRPCKASGSEGIPGWVTVDLEQAECSKAERSYRCPLRAVEDPIEGFGWCCQWEPGPSSRRVIRFWGI